MAGGGPVELTGVVAGGLGGTRLWSGREVDVQRLRQGGEDHALERPVSCGESGRRKWEERRFSATQRQPQTSER